MSIASPGKLSYITIFPMLSGYRTEQHEIEFTTEYIKVYEELLNEKARTDEHNPMVEEAKFLVVMPTNKVVSANQFDIDIFEKF